MLSQLILDGQTADPFKICILSGSKQTKGLLLSALVMVPKHRHTSGISTSSRASFSDRPIEQLIVSTASRLYPQHELFKLTILYKFQAFTTHTLELLSYCTERACTVRNNSMDLLLHIPTNRLLLCYNIFLCSIFSLSKKFQSRCRNPSWVVKETPSWRFQTDLFLIQINLIQAILQKQT